MNLHPSIPLSKSLPKPNQTKPNQTTKQLYVDGQMAGAKLKSPGQLKEALASAGVDTAKDTVCTCGSGLTACIVALGIHEATAGKVLTPVYDGSWCEWGAYEDTPIATDK